MLIKTTICGTPTVHAYLCCWQQVCVRLKNPKSQMPPVTTKEKEVLSLVAVGLTTKEIAEKLSMSVNTVNSYKSDMMELTRTQTTLELIAYVQKNGIL